LQSICAPEDDLYYHQQEGGGIKKRGKNGSRVSEVKIWHATGSSEVVIKYFRIWN